MAMTEEHFLKKLAQARKASQTRKAKLGAQARKDIAKAKKDIAKAKKEKSATSYTPLTHHNHQQILKTALQQCKHQTGNA